MRIIVVGCGKIGTAVISRFVKEGHNVVAIDNDAVKLAALSNIYDIICVCGNGADNDTLAQAGVNKADVLIAVTGSDELNMLSCFIARRMGARHTVSRIRNPEYNDVSFGFLKKELHLSLALNPERLAAKEIFNILKLPSAASIETFCSEKFEMIELRLKENSVLNGVKLCDLKKQVASDFLVCAVQRGEEVFIPDGNFSLSDGDMIAITAASTEIPKLFKEIKLTQNRARNIIILGASKVSYYLAQMLIKSGNSVKIIEKDEKRATEFSKALPKATIINGDGTDRDLLLEEGLDSADAFITLTGLDEVNILLSIYASNLNVKKVVTKVNSAELAQLAGKLGIDTIISPKTIVADTLSSYTRALSHSRDSRVETVYNLMNDTIEAIEFQVGEDFAFKGIPLSQLKTKKDTLIAGILRDGKIIIPGGNDCILAGDRVVVISNGKSLDQLSDIMI